MVYNIDGKYYILANRKFYEVEIKKDNKDNYDVQLIKNGRIKEYNKDMAYTQIALEKAYKSKKNSINLD